MTEHPSNNSISENILRKIERGEVSMRPRIFFTLKVAATLAVALIALVLSILVCNMLFFTIRISGHEALLPFGPSGIALFLRLFPWELLILAAASLALLQWMVQEFRFSYRVPVVYLFAGIFACSLVFGALLDRGTFVNDELFERAERHELPAPLVYIYEGARRPPPAGSGACRCTITSIDGMFVEAIDVRDGTTRSIVLPANSPRATTTSISVGDTVFIAGELRDGVMYAFVIDSKPPRLQRPRP